MTFFLWSTNEDWHFEKCHTGSEKHEYRWYTLSKYFYSRCYITTKISVLPHLLPQFSHNCTSSLLYIWLNQFSFLMLGNDDWIKLNLVFVNFNKFKYWSVSNISITNSITNIDLVLKLTIFRGQFGKGGNNEISRPQIINEFPKRTCFR